MSDAKRQAQELTGFNGRFWAMDYGAVWVWEKHLSVNS